MIKTPIAMLGIDLGKTSCSLAGLDATGAVVLRRRMTREALVIFVSKLPACVVAMEACCGAHFLGRTFQVQGHTVKLMAPEYVAPYVKAQKTDDRDAEAIAEAATRPTMRLVTLKSEAQLDLQVLHRARERLVAGRTRLTNQLRAVLLERGVILPKRRAPLSKRLDELMAGELAISPRALRLLQDLRDEWASLDRRIGAYDDELAALTREDDMARWLATIPGIGVINATALLACSATIRMRLRIAAFHDAPLRAVLASPDLLPAQQAAALRVRRHDVPELGLHPSGRAAAGREALTSRRARPPSVWRNSLRCAHASLRIPTMPPPYSDLMPPPHSGMMPPPLGVGLVGQFRRA